MISEEYYNINFQLKYHEIQQELLTNLTSNNEQLPDEEKYSEEDVECICRKIYLDECANIFYGEDFLDDKVDVGFRKVFDLMMENNEFKTYINDLSNTYSSTDDLNQMNNMNYFTFLSLFDMKIFYLMHQFISHYLRTNEIEQNLFQQIKQLNTIFSEK